MTNGSPENDETQDVEAVETSGGDAGPPSAEADSERMGPCGEGGVCDVYDCGGRPARFKHFGCARVACDADDDCPVGEASATAAWARVRTTPAVLGHVLRALGCGCGWAPLRAGLVSACREFGADGSALPSGPLFATPWPAAGCGLRQSVAERRPLREHRPRRRETVLLRIGFFPLRFA